MCGIVGYIGAQDAAQIIVEGLQRLEYRGYDSAGVAVVNGTGAQVRRSVGKLAHLAANVAANPVKGHIGIGHTRWATHGAPAEHNAHPHTSSDGRFVVVHNGIVENYRELRDDLTAEGVPFASETDTEVIVQLIARLASGGSVDVVTATRQAVAALKGAQAFVVLDVQQPDRLVAVRLGNAGGIAVGRGDGENFIASDIPALLDHTREFIFLDNGQMATITQDSYTVETLAGEPVEAPVQVIAWDPVSAAKGTYRHFMQKEIFEQPATLTDTLRGRIDFETGAVTLPDLPLDADTARSLERMVIVACGTSYFSGLVGKFFIEDIARLHVEVDYGSEYRYRDPILNDRTAVLAITQSGETVDTLAAMEEARSKGARLWSIVNVVGSQAQRMADGHILMNVGPEIGVASTKAFTASIIDQLLLALRLGDLRGTLSASQRQQYARDLLRLPDLVSSMLDQDAHIHRIARELRHVQNALFLGRGINYPIALEGALKLKEISYIHAEGYPAGEMKHGPIALIDETLPVIALALRDAVYDKMLSQIEQAKARDGVVIALATEGDTFIAEKADHVIYVPPAPAALNPVLTVIPLQLLAYNIAVELGKDADQPRNLAKSVTVE